MHISYYRVNIYKPSKVITENRVVGYGNSFFFQLRHSLGKINCIVLPRGNALLLGEYQMSTFSYSRCIHC